MRKHGIRTANGRPLSLSAVFLQLSWLSRQQPAASSRAHVAQAFGALLCCFVEAQATGQRVPAASDGGLSTEDAGTEADEDASVFAPGGQVSGLHSALAASECEAISQGADSKRRRKSQASPKQAKAAANQRRSGGSIMLPPFVGASASTAHGDQPPVSLPASASACAVAAAPDASMASVPMPSSTSKYAATHLPPLASMQPTAAALASSSLFSPAPPPQLRARGADLSGVAALLSLELRLVQAAMSSDAAVSGAPPAPRANFCRRDLSQETTLLSAGEGYASLGSHCHCSSRVVGFCFTAVTVHTRRPGGKNTIPAESISNLLFLFSCLCRAVVALGCATTFGAATAAGLALLHHTA